MHARLGTPQDAAVLARIYDEGIDDRTATFETRLRTEADVREWFDGAHPVVVVEDADGEVVGFARASAYGTRECYAGVFELAVYVARNRRRRGAGKAAVSELVAQARAA